MGTRLSITIPGAFMGYMTGSSVYQQTDAEHGWGEPGTELQLALRNAAPRKVGRGTAYTLDLSPAAAAILADYADTCAVVNADDGDPTEARAGRTVLERCRAAGVPA
jgi:hypothetical protein